jgi:hypothetical protein
VDARTIEKYEKEAKEKNRDSWFLAFIMVRQLGWWKTCGCCGLGLGIRRVRAWVAGLGREAGRRVGNERHSCSAADKGAAVGKAKGKQQGSSVRRCLPLEIRQSQSFLGAAGLWYI